MNVDSSRFMKIFICAWKLKWNQKEKEKPVYFSKKKYKKKCWKCGKVPLIGILSTHIWMENTHCIIHSTSISVYIDSIIQRITDRHTHTQSFIYIAKNKVENSLMVVLYMFFLKNIKIKIKYTAFKMTCT